jgi:hypothetical protein
VIAYGRGGALETVTADLSDGDDPASCTGVFFLESTADSLCDAIQRFERIESRFRPRFIRNSVERFSLERFKGEFATFVLDKMGEFSEAT